MQCMLSVKQTALPGTLHKLLIVIINMFILLFRMFLSDEIYLNDNSQDTSCRSGTLLLLHREIKLLKNIKKKSNGG